MRCWLVIGLAGCGRLSFDPAADGRTGAPDVSIDGGCETSGHWQLVPNGNFESGDLGAWTNVQPTRAMYVVEPNHGIGGYSVHSIPIVTQNIGTSIQQDIVVVPGSSYVLSGYFRVDELVQGDQTYLDLNDVPFDVNLTPTSGTSGWVFRLSQVDIPAGTSLVTIRLVHDGNITPSRTSYADEIAFTPLAEFSGPTMPCL
jgi:hypothetical protein